METTTAAARDALPQPKRKLAACRHFYELACELNNIGAALLEMRRSDLAEMTFVDAIDALKRHIHLSDVTCLFPQKEYDLNYFDLDPMIIRALERLTKTSHEESMIHQREQEGGMFLQWRTVDKTYSRLTPYQAKKTRDENVSNIKIYESPIRLTNFFRYSQQCAELASAVILYNMALDRHTQDGIETGSRSSNDGAIILYKMALDSIFSKGKLIEIDCIENFGCLLGIVRSVRTFAMIILNNLAQIQYEMGKYEVAVSCFEEILKIQKDENSVERENNIWWDMFVMNSLFLEPPTTASAA